MNTKCIRRCAFHSCILAVVLCLILFSERTQAGSRIHVPISWSAVEGSPAEAAPNVGDDMTTDAVLWRRHERPTDHIYAPQADISFRSAVNNIWNTGLSFPIIPDQDLSVGNPGDLVVELDSNDDLVFTGELGDTLLAAYEAWEDLDPTMTSQVYGIVAVNVNQIIDNLPDFTVGGVGGGFSDPSGPSFRFAVMMDNTYLYPGTGNDTLGIHDPKDALTGHEFGHALGLDHINNVNNLMNPSVVDNSGDGDADNLQLTNSQENTVRNQAMMLNGHETDPPNVYIPSPLVTQASVDRSPDPTGVSLGPHEDLKMTFVELDRKTDTLRISQMLGGLISNVPSLGEPYEFWTFMNTDDNPVTGATSLQLAAIGAADPTFLGGELVLRVSVNTELVDVGGQLELQPVLDATAWQAVGGALVPVPSSLAALPQLTGGVAFLEPDAPMGTETALLEAVTLELDNSLLADPLAIDEYYRFESMIVRPETPSTDAEITDRLAGSDIGRRSILQEASFAHAFQLDVDQFPNGVPVGETIEIQVEGLLPDSPYHGIFGLLDIDPGMTASDGTAQFELAIPADVPPGPHLLTIGIDGTALTADMLILVVPEPSGASLVLLACAPLALGRRSRFVRTLWSTP